MGRVAKSKLASSSGFRTVVGCPSGLKVQILQCPPHPPPPNSPCPCSADWPTKSLDLWQAKPAAVPSNRPSTPTIPTPRWILTTFKTEPKERFHQKAKPLEA